MEKKINTSKPGSLRKKIFRMTGVVNHQQLTAGCSRSLRSTAMQLTTSRTCLQRPKRLQFQAWGWQAAGAGHVYAQIYVLNTSKCLDSNRIVNMYGFGHIQAYSDTCAHRHTPTDACVRACVGPWISILMRNFGV